MFKKILNSEFFFNQVIILSFSFNFFFWDQNFFNFPVRFLYLFIIFYFYKLDFNNNIFFLKKILLLFILILIHYFFSFFLINKFDILNIAKIGIAFITFLIIFFNIEIIEKNFSKIVDFFLFFFVTFYILLFFNEIINLNFKEIGCSFYSGVFSAKYNLYEGKKLFQENSHFGIISCPLLIYCYFNIVFNKKNFFRNIFILLFTIICVINFSYTFFVGFLASFIFLFLFFFNKKLIINYFIFFIILILIFLNVVLKNKSCIEKHTETLNIPKTIYSLEKGNFKPIYNIGLSHAVFLQAGHITLLSFKQSIFGFGFDNYKYAYDIFYGQTDRYHYYFYQGKVKLNRNDASNNFFKIITEFGIFGIIFLINIFIVFFSKYVPFHVKTFIIPLIITQTFIRGGGYFNGGYLTATIILMVFFYKKKFLNKC